MRHRKSGRKLGRTSSHRKAMFRNMACSLIRSVRVYEEEDPGSPKVPGRIITTVAKAKALRPVVEKLITLARNAREHEEKARNFESSAKKNSSEWKQWRESDKWQQWNQAIAPAVALRRRAFSQLRDNEVVDILFDELAERFEDRDGGYTRVVRLAEFRLGDAGQKALIEFVGVNDRTRTKRRSPAPVVTDEENTTEETASTETAQEETSENQQA